MLFLYIGTTLLHQVISQGTPVFTPSALNDPSDNIPFKQHTVIFTTPGTYKFTDNFNNALSGQIVVQ